MSRNALATLRGIVKELRKCSPGTKLSEDPAFNFVMLRYRANQVTTEKVCRNPKGALHQAQTYLCYLESLRTNQELLESYRGKGERSIEESADLVGLRLPKRYEDDEKS